MRMRFFEECNSTRRVCSATAVGTIRTRSLLRDFWMPRDGSSAARLPHCEMIQVLQRTVAVKVPAMPLVSQSRHSWLQPQSQNSTQSRGAFPVIAAGNRPSRRRSGPGEHDPFEPFELGQPNQPIGLVPYFHVGGGVQALK
jgi:hypothetical protein